ncbi:MAG: hypothetical protein ACJAYP_000435 [Flavobacterium sp.]|jgi:hypothetical protein
MNKTIITLVLFVLLSCKKELGTENFVLEIDLYSRVSDSIHIYYLEKNSLAFSEEKSIWKSIKENNSNQIIEIVFPQDIKPKQLRVDFGHNVSVQEIVINKINFNYKNNSYALKGAEIYQFFRPDESNTILDSDSGLLKRKFENQKAVFSIYPKGEKLQKKLEKIYLRK